MRIALDAAARKVMYDQGRPAAAVPTLGPRDLEQIIRVTVETATMLPHEALQTRTMHGTVVVNGTPAKTTTFESRRSRFTYDGA